MFLKISQISQENSLFGVSFRPATLFKKDFTTPSPPKKKKQKKKNKVFLHVKQNRKLHLIMKQFHDHHRVRKTQEFKFSLPRK